jgi:SAM-dependent methyltransferase
VVSKLARMEPADPAPTRRFSDRAHDYARFRPDYPAAAVDAMLAGLQRAPGQLAIADVGAGTGILSRLLADRGAHVTAIEPNAAMRDAAEPHPRVRFADGTAEATQLDDGAVDLVTVAQAFHWFDVPRALREFHRVLRPGGRLAILWNHRSRTEPFTLGYRHALQAIDGEAPVDRSTFDPATVTASGLFTAQRTCTFAHAQPLTEAELLGRARSTSTVPREGPQLERLLTLLRELHARHRGADGRATMVYRTDVHLWDRVV